ncbi:MAG TPA: peptidylprolyl isomerase [Reyranellaceae bacterium]|nr:peptidylprolyl isomerase [Reyranellaceae bacterium]
MRLRSRSLRLAVLASAAIALGASAAAQTPPAQKPPAQAQKPPGPPKDPVVATINGQAIRLSEVEALQKELPPQYRQMPIEAVFPALIDRLVNVKLVVQEARKAKVQDDAGYKKRLAFVEEQVLQEFWVQRELERRVTTESLKKRYDELVKQMPPEEEVRARHILVATEDEAKALIAEIKKGGAFDKLARDKSTDKASGAEGGDLGWFKKIDMVPEFANAAFALKKDEVTEAPVKSQFGFHIIQLQDRRQAAPPPFEDVADKLREEATRETVTTIINTLRAGAKVEKFNIDGSKVEAAPPSGTPAPATPPAKK